MEIGDLIIWTADFVNASSIRSGTVSKMRGDECWVDQYHKPEDCIYKAWCWPAAYKERLVAAISERARLKAAFDDSMKLIYELRNCVARGEK